MQPSGRQLAAAPPRWVPWAATLICSLAVLDASYLTYAHYSSPKVLYCTIGGIVNCGAVTTSTYSRFLGMPVAVLGLAWAAAMLVLCIPTAWRAGNRWVARLRLLGSVAGVAMVFWLVYAELFKLGLICLYCTFVHILTIALFVVIAFGMALAVPGGTADEAEGAEEAEPRGEPASHAL